MYNDSHVKKNNAFHSFIIIFYFLIYLLNWSRAQWEGDEVVREGATKQMIFFPSAAVTLGILHGGVSVSQGNSNTYALEPFPPIPSYFSTIASKLVCVFTQL